MKVFVFLILQGNKKQSPSFHLAKLVNAKDLKSFSCSFGILGSSPRMKKAYNSIWLEYQLDKLKVKGSSPFKLRHLEFRIWCNWFHVSFGY